MRTACLHRMPSRASSARRGRIRYSQRGTTWRSSVFSRLKSSSSGSSMNSTDAHKVVAPEVRAFVIANFLFGQGGETFRDDDSFQGKGIIDSTGVLELIGFLETQY